MLLVALVGIVVAFVRWRRHPVVSALTTIALVIYLIRSFTLTAFYYWLPSLRESMHLSWNAIDNLSTALGVFSDIIFAIVLLMLVIAAFSKRVPQTV